MRCYLGWDEREADAYRVARSSLLSRASVPVEIIGINHKRLEKSGVFYRPMEKRGNVLWDFASDAPMSTEFANARFMVPILAQSGWVAFLDCDVLVLDDIKNLFDLADSRYAVMCVQHVSNVCNVSTKMDGQPQLPYQRKNWSSVMLINCDHPANDRLTVNMVESMPGRDLHRFVWLDDSEIGALPAEWNWLVGVQTKPDNPKIAHYTLGGPWIPGWVNTEHDQLWLEERYASRAA